MYGKFNEKLVRKHDFYFLPWEKTWGLKQLAFETLKKSFIGNKGI